nr:IS3 family transposase [Blastococcus xanthinilyticus]
MAAEKAKKPALRISIICRLLGVSTSGYYGWLSRSRRPLKGRAAEDRELLAHIRLIHGRFSYYGAPRIYRSLRAKGLTVGRHRVARLMRAHGIRARRGPIKARRRSAPPSRRPEVIDRVRRQFRASAPDRLWFTDLTAIRTSEGFLRAAVVLDAHNRQVISWSTDTYETPKTVIRAFREAIDIRRPAPGCIIHSDRGYQFTSHEWHELAARHGLVVSLGERKSALDNAAMESWFGSLKNEDIHPGGAIKTFADARSRLFHYIWDYNNHRLHSALGYRTPAAYAMLST